MADAEHEVNGTEVEDDEQDNSQKKSDVKRHDGGAAGKKLFANIFLVIFNDFNALYKIKTFANRSGKGYGLCRRKRNIRCQYFQRK